MIFEETKLSGAFTLIPDKIHDERGFFARTWDQKIFEEHKLNSNLVQCNISYNKKKGTIRGMHYQINPYEECKLVHCTKGKAFEVMVDLRKNSKTFKQWQGITLDSNDNKLLYVPDGFALGFQTLEDNTQLFYQMSQIYMPDFARGFRYDDKMFQISWPIDVSIISKKDLSFPIFHV